MIEKLSFLNANKYDLSGVLNNGRIKSPLIVLLHGFASNKDHSLLTEAENYFASKNYDVFRYDVSGAGESQGNFLDSSLESQANDLKFALDYLRDRYNDNIVNIIGFSLGATVSVIQNDPRVDNYIFWSPALFPAIDMYPRYNSPEINDSLKIKGYIEKDGLKVGKKIIGDLGNTFLEEKLSSIKQPVLMIQGTEDPRINYQNTIKGSHFIKNSKVVLIPGADHSFKNGYRKELFDKTYSWLKELRYK